MSRHRLLLFLYLFNCLKYHLGKSTGIVTTARITHATPSAAYAHSAERNWENDSKLRSTKRGVPSEYNEPFKCKDIAAQLVEENANINVSVV